MILKQFRTFGLFGAAFIVTFMLSWFGGSDGVLGGQAHANTHCDPANLPNYQPSSADDEMDRFYALMAYAVVYKRWQDSSPSDGAAGYNIGSVMANESNQFVCWACNSVGATHNSTQHGEVRLMTNYLNQEALNNPSTEGEFHLQGYKIYTTLQPCAMCSGMMTLTNLEATIYGQTDPSYGGALGRLQYNSSQDPGGYCPYPRGVYHQLADVKVASILDDMYANWSKTNGTDITQFLTTPQVQALYEEATNQFMAFEAGFAENTQLVAYAKQIYSDIPDGYVPTPYGVACDLTQ
ncbi:MAG: hypothetical protein OIF58_09820 [Cohaesibacter sp.]|nr:hypothetical protein [Cohaesibacter sp.]